MREQNSITNESTQNWDTGTYQTGASKPQKGQSITITVLLMTVIFLGGIASALGVMNVRLLMKLTQQSSELNISVEATQGSNAVSYDFFHNDEPMQAKLPEEELLELRLGFRVQELDTLCRQFWELSNGLEVISVTDGSQLQLGDILTSINGEKLTELSQLYSIAEKAQQGDLIRFSVLRVGQQFTIELTVQEP